MRAALLTLLLVPGLLGSGPARAGTLAFAPTAGAGTTPSAIGAAATAPDTVRGKPFYGIRLTPPGQPFGRRLGYAAVAFPESPFNVAVTERGVYVYDLHVVATALRPRPGAVHVLWLASPDLDHVEKVGVLERDDALRTRVSFDNKFVLFVTEEASADASRPTGRVVARGISRSGRMESMFSHGASP